MFKRRRQRSIFELIADTLYPRGGWGRAASYVVHRLRRLPDPPYKIARGIFAGVLVTFTPFFGLHFIIAAIIARIIRGNILAALLATFFGNPLTYVPIAVISLQTGHFMLGTQFDPNVDRGIVGKFLAAGGDLFTNLWNSFLGRPTDWQALGIFYYEVFLPFSVGGIIPGLVAGLIAYYLSVPLITAYQKRRLASLKERAQKRLEKRNAKNERRGTD